MVSLPANHMLVVLDLVTRMNGLFQMMVVLLVFGPLIVGTLIWHIVWNNKSGPSSDPPSGGGPTTRPDPPLPRRGGDRSALPPGLQRSRTQWHRRVR